MSETYPIDETVVRMQEIIYGILCEIDDVCRKNNIRYYLSGGTCLGAVRHHGFIPWDDDGDVMMPRQDYERFVSLFNGSCSQDYRLCALSLDPAWNLPYARVWFTHSRIIHQTIYDPDIGVYVDIFPIDGIPAGDLGRKRFFLHVQFLNEMCTEAKRKHYNTKTKLIRRCAKPVAGLFGARYFANRMNEYVRRFDFETSADVACSLPAHYGDREIIPRECMSSQVWMPFRGREFAVPAGYDRYLRNLYGERYMEVPKPSEIVNHQRQWEVVFGDE